MWNAQSSEFRSLSTATQCFMYHTFEQQCDLNLFLMFAVSRRPCIIFLKLSARTTKVKTKVVVQKHIWRVCKTSETPHFTQKNMYISGRKNLSFEVFFYTCLKWPEGDGTPNFTFLFQHYWAKMTFFRAWDNGQRFRTSISTWNGFDWVQLQNTPPN